MAQTYSKLLYHIIFSTKNRMPLLDKTFRQELYRYISGIACAKECTSIEVGGVEDHIHILVQIPSSIAVADLVRVVKSNSSKWLNETKFRIRKFGWQDGYAAFSVSQSQIARVARYIRGQEQHHHKADFKSELISLLKRHGIEYDDACLWK